MRRAVLVVVVIGLLQPALAAGQVAESLRQQIKVREDLLAQQPRPPRRAMRHVTRRTRIIRQRAVGERFAIRRTRRHRAHAAGVSAG